ncbi:MAG TPA: hypothetical protein PKD85_21655, partial [Saprospiraceae bacterium]|nr:hypothetical protein [Saprospiraceae bacterium]
MKVHIKILLLILLFNQLGLSAIKLPAFFSDYMVMQRDKPIIIYGYAEYEKSVIINFDGDEQEATIDKLGLFEAV